MFARESICLHPIAVGEFSKGAVGEIGRGRTGRGSGRGVRVALGQVAGVGGAFVWHLHGTAHR
jgi:hypothetical protein